MSCLHIPVSVLGSLWLEKLAWESCTEGGSKKLLEGRKVALLPTVAKGTQLSKRPSLGGFPPPLVSLFALRTWAAAGVCYSCQE